MVHGNPYLGIITADSQPAEVKYLGKAPATSPNPPDFAAG